MAKQKVKDELLDHDYDGIQELDNDLPPWWLYLFYFTIIWGVAYLLYYHVFGVGDLQYAEYENEMKAAQAQYSAAEEAPAREAEATAPLTGAASIESGKTVYVTHCQVCHGQNGEGTVGPNMTDEYWVHGGKYSDIINTINVGVPEKGMISWRPVLKPEEIEQVASYILTLQGTNPPNAKAPEGEKMEDIQ